MHANHSVESIGRSGSFGTTSVIDYRRVHFNRLPTLQGDLPVIISMRDWLLNRRAFSLGSGAGCAWYRRTVSGLGKKYIPAYKLRRAY